VANADAVEAAFARAITEASGAGRFDIVAQLADELRARRLDQEGGCRPRAGPSTEGSLTNGRLRYRFGIIPLSRCANRNMDLAFSVFEQTRKKSIGLWSRVRWTTLWLSHETI
jgi:hypothetical protein